MVHGSGGAFGKLSLNVARQNGEGCPVHSSISFETSLKLTV